jgi:hypothetical protein
MKERKKEGMKRLFYFSELAGKTNRVVPYIVYSYSSNSNNLDR